MKLINRIFIPHRIIFILLIIYFIIHLTKVTLLPIFNDESIYLDWGWSYTHLPGSLYNSLLDAKQPLMIWIFGFFENFFSDPLFAGRFVSVLFGALTEYGIFKLSERLFTRQTALFSTLSYILIPIFVFYNRQALFESAVASLAVWSCIFLLNTFEKPTIRNNIYLGILLGLGFFIKTTFLIFIASAFILLIYFAIRKRSLSLAKTVGISVVVMLTVDFLLLINPLFWQTFSSNSRYAFSLGELLRFPVATWFSSLAGFFEIGFTSISPLIFLESIIGIFILLKKRKTDIKIVLVYFLFSLFLEIFSVKSQSQRYLLPFLPFLVIPAGYILTMLWEANMLKKVIVTISFSLPCIATTMLIFNPYGYIVQLNKYSQYSNIEYVSGQTSGYGLKEAMQYVEDHSSLRQPTLVLFGLNAGNPENAVDVYSAKSTNLFGLHIDRKFFTNIDQVTCMTSTEPVYLVTREDQTLGLQEYFTLTKKFDNPDGNYFIGLYTLKPNCKGNSVSLSDLYQNPVMELSQIKNGY